MIGQSTRTELLRFLHTGPSRDVPGSEPLRGIVPGGLADFVEQYRVRVKRDDCGEPIVPGKVGRLYEHDASRFGVVLEVPPDDARSDKTLRARRRRAIATGFVVHQEGEFEALLLFDPGDGKQAALDVRLIRAKKIRQAARATDASN